MSATRMTLAQARLLRLPASLRSLLFQQSNKPASPLSTPARSFSISAPHASSVDPTEVSHFNALASSWWDPHGPSRLLHLMNPLRHRFINSCLNSQADPPRILPTSSALMDASSTEIQGLTYLDVGCGGGIFAESAARMPGVRAVTGVDPSGEVLAIAKQHARRDPNLWETGRLQYMNCGIEDLPAPRHAGTRTTTDVGDMADAGVGSLAAISQQKTTATAGDIAAVGVGSMAAITQSGHATQETQESQAHDGYDIVSLWEVLEHVSSPHAFLDILTPHVKPGGWFVMSTIARTWTSWVTTKLFAEDILRIVPRGTHDWGKYINEPEVRKYFATRPGWESPRAMGVLYVPGIGWREAKGGEDWGNYLWAVRRSPV